MLKHIYRLIPEQYSGIHNNAMIYRDSFNGRNWLVLFFMFISLHITGQIHFDQSSEYRYLKGPAAATLSSDWVSPSFNDAYWTKGYAPFWYGDGSGGTVLEDMRDNYSTLYLRSKFLASNSQQIHELHFEVDYDDGFIIWINGIQVLNMFGPENPVYNDFATDLHESGTPETFYINAVGIPLYDGYNTIAVQVFNANLGSSDLHFNVTLDAGLDLPVYPDTIEVEFSRASGYYSAPFDLSFSYDDDSAALYYTLDGRHPGLSPNALPYIKGTTVIIDPDSENNRGKTPAVVVRAAFRLEGYRPSPPVSATYIFADKINYQEHPGGDWPTDNVNEQRLDFAIDQNISLGSLYSSRMEGAYTDLPALSIITDNANLFSADSGIYVNAFGHGPAWERECSVDLIDLDREGFSVNAGIRIRGGWSRHGSFPKHSFRLFFS